MLQNKPDFKDHVQGSIKCDNYSAMIEYNLSTF